MATYLDPTSLKNQKPTYVPVGQAGQHDPNDPELQMQAFRQNQLGGPTSAEGPPLQQPGQPGPVNVQGPPLQPAPPPGAPPDPFQAMGGGHWTGQQWVPSNHPLAQQSGAPAPGAPTPGTPTGTNAAGQPTTLQGALGGTAAPGTQTAQGQPTTVAGAFQQALINRLAPQDLTVNNPAIKGSIAANRAAEDRGLKQTRGALAERAAATGQTGAFESGLQQAIGESAGRQGAFAGNALYGLHQQQANDLTNALALGGGLLEGMDTRALQRYGIDLDAALRREGLGAQTSLGNRELDIRNALGQGQLDLSRLGLAQNESQFTRGLGANLGIEQARLNMNSLLGLLNGL